jgi:hypothetical protein
LKIILEKGNFEIKLKKFLFLHKISYATLENYKDFIYYCSGNLIIEIQISLNYLEFLRSHMNQLEGILYPKEYDFNADAFPTD